LHRVLDGAGFQETSFTPLDVVMELAGSGGAEEAAEFAMLFGPVTCILPALPQERHEAVGSALERFFQSHVTQQAAALPAELWVVQARALGEVVDASPSLP
jgi:hypothetical protein